MGRSTKYNTRTIPGRAHAWICFTTVMMVFALIGSGCRGNDQTSEDTGTEPAEEERQVQIPAFNRDSAYHFIERQVMFGPRNPGSSAIEECRDWIAGKMAQYGATVIRQEFDARVYTGDVFPSVNIIAQFNPSHPQRILLAAHYDTRFMAEEDDDPARRAEPIPGADDGASGVAVLIEIARLLSEHPIDMGIDMIFFDAEDQGEREAENDTWCLGAQYWGRNLHKPGYDARFGILLDMVGAKNAFFNKENVTGFYPHAARVHDLYEKVWNLASAMGKGRYFQNRRIQGIVDDHLYVNRLTGIPMIDIINKPPQNDPGFAAHWHTHDDDMDVIDKNTLGSVGQVVTAVLYRASAGRF